MRYHVNRLLSTLITEDYNNITTSPLTSSTPTWPPGLIRKVCHGWLHVAHFELNLFIIILHFVGISSTARQSP